MANYQKLKKNVIALTIGNFSSKILTFLLVPFYTSILTTTEYGTADLITTTINLVLPVFTLMIYEAVMRHSLDGTNRNQIFSWGCYITFLGSILILCFLPILFFIEGLKNYIFLFYLSFVSLAFYHLIMQFAKGIGSVYAYSICGIINTLCYILCNLLFLLVFNMRVEGYVISSVVSHTITGMIAFFVIKGYKYVLPIKRLETLQFKQMIEYSMPMIPNSISWWINSSLNKYILILACGVAANGLYSAANKIPTILTVLVTIFISAWQISSVENFGSAESKKFYEDVYEKYESLLFILGGGLVFCVKLLSKIMLSNNFYTAWVFTPVLIYAFILSSLASFWGSIYTASKKTKMILTSTLIGAGVNILCNILLVSCLEIHGVAIATTVGYMSITLIRMIDARKILPINVNFKKIVILNLLTIVEIIFVCIGDYNCFYLPAFLCFATICFVCRKTIFELTKTIYYNFVKKRIRRN